MSYQREFENRIKIAVIGAGSHCYRNILPALNWLPVELIAICDVNYDMVHKTAKQYACTAYTKTDEMYAAHPEVEAVLICVGAKHHPSLMREALLKCKHVWVEKPIATRAVQVEELIPLVKDKIVVVGLKKAFTPVAAKVEEILDSPEYIGFHSMLAVYHMSIPKDGNAALEGEELPNWLRNGVHPLSFMVGIGGNVHSVTTLLNDDGFGVVGLQFKNGVFGTLHLASGPQPDVEQYSLFGDSWQLDITDDKLALRRGLPSFDYRKTVDYLPEDGGVLVWEANNCVATLENKSEFVQGFYAELMEFCNCIIEDRKPVKGSLEMALEIMRVYEAALLSNGKTIII